MEAPEPLPEEPVFEPGRLEEAPFPWPPPEGESFIDSAIRTWHGSVLRPSAFFRRMPRAGSVRPALFYYLIVGILAEAINLFWRLVLGPMEFAAGGRFAEFLEPSDPLVDFLLTPVVLLLVLVVAGAVTHVMLKILGGARHGFRSTIAVLCYSQGPALFAVVPRIGVLVGLVWMTVLVIIGLREAHETTTFRAVAAVLLPAFLFFGMLVLLVLLLISAAMLPPLA